MNNRSTKRRQKNRQQDQAQEQKSQASYLPEVRIDDLAVEVRTRHMPVQTNSQISKSISFRLIGLLIYLLVLLLPI